MKKILFLLLVLPFLATAQPVTTTITSDGSVVTIATPVNSKQCAVCNFNWVIVDGNLRMWITGSNEIVPGGRLKFFTISGVTDNALKDEALGAISDQCDQGGSGGGQTVLLQESTSTAGTSTSNNYHKGRLGVGDFSSDNVQAKMHLYDVAQAIFRISDEAASDTAAITYFDFWRGKNTARLGRVGYLYNTDNNLYLLNSSTGGGVDIGTNGVSNLKITPGGQIRATSYGLGSFGGEPAYFATFDADGNLQDTIPYAEPVSVAIPLNEIAYGTGSGITSNIHKNFSNYVLRLGNRDTIGRVGGLDIRSFDGTAKMLVNYQNSGSQTGIIYMHKSIENAASFSNTTPMVSFVASRYAGGSNFNSIDAVPGQIIGGFAWQHRHGGNNGSGVIWVHGIKKAGTASKLTFFGGTSGALNNDTTQTSRIMELHGDTKAVKFFGPIQSDGTITAGGTVGNQTINKATGTVNIASAGTSVTVTNSLVTERSIVIPVLRTNDSTAAIKNCVPGAGSFVITLTAAATSEVSIGFVVIN
jgi:hypothetical protein